METVSAPPADRTRARAWHVPAAIVLSCVLGALALETGARAFWRIAYQLPLGRPDRVLYAFYPELRGVDESRPRRGDGYFDILLLGGSVLGRGWGEVEPALAEQLAAAGLRNVRIFNLGMPAHTSRDSLLKYTALDGVRFDLVVFYHGVNDARTNNMPPDLFRSDYSHYSWYATVNAVAPAHGHALFALPYTLRYAVASAKQSMNPGLYAPTHEPRPDWVQYGGSLRSVAVFEDNVRHVVAMAAERGDPLLLMTFASHVPADYSREAFMRKTLDYRLHRLPIEMWGRRDQVMAALAAHNDVLRRVAAEHPEVLLVDQARLLEGCAKNFDDPVHLTADGSVEFARHMVDAIRPKP
jgi:lysophospholipase L1-like esterase